MTGTKREMVELLFQQLVKRGTNPRRDVKAGNGVADIVTDEAVYEVVAVASADVILGAIPHVLGLRHAVNPDLKAVIFGGHPGIEPTARMAVARQWGVTVNLLKAGETPNEINITSCSAPFHQADRYQRSKNEFFFFSRSTGE